MKTFVFLVAILSLLSSTTFGQSTGYCVLNEEQEDALTQQGGFRLTTFGTVKALLIFIDFSDDTVDIYNDNWPLSEGPNFLDKIVDTTEGQKSGEFSNITTFFNDMSYGQFEMIGKAYYVQAPHTLSWYVQNHSGAEASYAAADAIGILDETVDFEDFDRWVYNGPFEHSEGQDENLDMVFICFRVWYKCPRCIGCCSFLAEGWYGASLPGGSVDVDEGARHIISSQAVDVTEMIQYPRLEHMVHELGHVWGLPHNYAGGLWTLMGHQYPSVSSFMNSYEREQLGWISYTPVTTDGQTASVADFGNAAVAYRIPIPNTNPQEYYLIENHQMISDYDVVDLTDGIGLYILHDDGVRHVQANNVRVVAADGRWNWSNPYWIHNPWSENPLDSIPVYKREEINRNLGHTDKMLIPHSKNDSTLVHAWLDEQTGEQKTGPRFKGDGFDRYTLEDNNVFSPWSGYAAYDWTGTTETTIGLEITGTNGSNINVKFYTETPYAASPSKPMGLQISVYNSGYNYYPRLDWEAMEEPDVVNGGHILVTRRTKQFGQSWSSWSLHTALAGTDTQYTDLSISTAGSGTDSVQYRIQAKDSTDKTSVNSDVVSMNLSNEQQKISDGSNGETPVHYMLHEAFPDPFNPSTTFKFDLPEDGNVSLIIYDILGREVVTLISGYHRGGYHSATWNASNVASGVYFARFTATDATGQLRYSKVNKLVLMK